MRWRTSSRHPWPQSWRPLEVFAKLGPWRLNKKRSKTLASIPCQAPGDDRQDEFVAVRSSNTEEMGAELARLAACLNCRCDGRFVCSALVLTSGLPAQTGRTFRVCGRRGDANAALQTITLLSLSLAKRELNSYPASIQIALDSH